RIIDFIIYIYINKHRSFISVIKAVTIRIYPKKDYIRNTIMIMIVPFNIIGHPIIITVFIHKIRKAVTISINRYYPEVSVLFISIINTIIVYIQTTWRNIALCSLGFYIVRNTIIIAIDI